MASISLLFIHRSCASKHKRYKVNVTTTLLGKLNGYLLTSGCRVRYNVQYNVGSNINMKMGLIVPYSVRLISLACKMSALAASLS